MKRQKNVGQIRNELLAGLSELDKKTEPLEGQEELTIDTQKKDLTVEEARKEKFQKPVKSKRSYMLREDTIEKITDLKRIFKNNDFSEIVTMGVDLLYEKHKEKIYETFQR